MIVTAQVTEDGTSTQQRHTAACHDAFFNRGTGRMQRVFDASLLLLHFDFSSRTDLDQGYAARQFGNTFLQLFLVVIGSRLFDLQTNLLDASFDVGSGTGTVDDGGVFLADFDTLGLTELSQRCLLEGQTDFFGDNLTTGQDGDVFEHGLAAIAEARRLDGTGLENATDVVDHQRCQRFTFDVFRHDQQRTAGFGDLLEHGQEVANVRDLLVEEQHERVFQNGDLLVWIVDEVGRQIAAVELHAFDNFEFVHQGLAVFNSDNAFLANLFHGVGDDVTD